MNEEKLAAAAVHDPKPDYSEEIKKIIGGVSSPQSVKEKLADYHENDIAEAMSEMEVWDVPLVVKSWKAVSNRRVFFCRLFSSAFPILFIPFSLFCV